MRATIRYVFNAPGAYLIFCKERPLERPTIFWRMKLIRIFRESVPGRSADALYVGRSADALYMAGTLFYAKKNAKKTHFRGKNTRFCEKSREIVAFFRKNRNISAKTKN